ncbi:hypothetical protein Tco_0495215, partial [Tanacetum coccineum]
MVDVCRNYWPTLVVECAEKKESLESLLAVRDIPRRGELKKDYEAYE